MYLYHRFNIRRSQWSKSWLWRHHCSSQTCQHSKMINQTITIFSIISCIVFINKIQNPLITLLSVCYHEKVWVYIIWIFLRISDPISNKALVKIRDRLYLVISLSLYICNLYVCVMCVNLSGNEITYAIDIFNNYFKFPIGQYK